MKKSIENFRVLFVSVLVFASAHLALAEGDSISPESCQHLKNLKITENEVIIPNKISVSMRNTEEKKTFIIKDKEKFLYDYSWSLTTFQVKGSFTGWLSQALPIPLPNEWSDQRSEQSFYPEKAAEKGQYSTLAMSKLDADLVGLKIQENIPEEAELGLGEIKLATDLETKVSSGSWKDFTEGKKIELQLSSDASKKAFLNHYLAPLNDVRALTLIATMVKGLVHTSEDIELKISPLKISDFDLSKFTWKLSGVLRDFEVSWAYAPEISVGIDMDLIVRGEAKTKFLENYKKVCQEQK